MYSRSVFYLPDACPDIEAALFYKEILEKFAEK